MKRAIFKHQPRLTPNQSIHFRKEDDIRMSRKPSPHFKSEQASTKHFKQNSGDQFGFKCIQSDMLSNLEKIGSTPIEKYRVYEKALEYFGERVVKGKFDLWIDKFWRDGNVYVFLLNNGCWQVAFREMKSFRIYAVD
jgi:hypothetical protein